MWVVSIVLRGQFTYCSNKVVIAFVGRNSPSRELQLNHPKNYWKEKSSDKMFFYFSTDNNPTKIVIFQHVQYLSCPKSSPKFIHYAVSVTFSPQ